MVLWKDLSLFIWPFVREPANAKAPYESIGLILDVYAIITHPDMAEDARLIARSNLAAALPERATDDIPILMVYPGEEGAQTDHFISLDGFISDSDPEKYFSMFHQNIETGLNRNYKSRGR